MAKRNLRQRIEEKVFKSRIGVEYSSGASQIRHATAGGRARMLSGRATAALAALTMMATTAITPLILSPNSAVADDGKDNGSICIPSAATIGTVSQGTTDTGVATWVGQDMYIGSRPENTAALNSTNKPTGSYAVEAEGLTLVNGKLAINQVKNSWKYTNNNETRYPGFRFGAVGFGANLRPEVGSTTLVVAGDTTASNIGTMNTGGVIGNVGAWTHGAWTGFDGENYVTNKSGQTVELAYGALIAGNATKWDSNSARTSVVSTKSNYSVSGDTLVFYNQSNPLSSVNGVNYANYNNTGSNFGETVKTDSTKLSSASVTGATSTSDINSGSVTRAKYNNDNHKVKINYGQIVWDDNTLHSADASLVNKELLITFAVSDDHKNDQLQVFNLDASILNNAYANGYTGVSFSFEGIPVIGTDANGKDVYASVVVNVDTSTTNGTVDFHNGWNFNWNGTEIGSYYANTASTTQQDLYNAAASSVLWNFSSASSVTIRGGMIKNETAQWHGGSEKIGKNSIYSSEPGMEAYTVSDDPSAAMLGSIWVPNGDFDDHVTTNGRVYVGGDYMMDNPYQLKQSGGSDWNGSESVPTASLIDMDQERHNYSFSASVTMDCPTISWEKTDADGNQISGASFQIFGSLNAATDTTGTVSPLMTVTDNQALYDQDSRDGVIKIQNLAANATYYIKEVAAPDGYKTSTNIYRIDTGTDTSANYNEIVKVYSRTGQEITADGSVYVRRTSSPDDGTEVVTYGIINNPEGTEVAWAKHDAADAPNVKTVLEGSSWVLNDGTTDYLITDNATPVDSVSILDSAGTDWSKRTVSMATGDSRTFSAEVLPEDANPNVKWTSSNPSLVAVNDGVVTVLRNYNDDENHIVTITATSEDGTESAWIRIYCHWAAVDSVTILRNGSASGDFSLEKGTTSQLSATTNPAGVSVTWSSSSESVATVDSTGLVTAKKVGTAVITANASGTTSSITVTVTNSTITTIYFSTDASGWGSGTPYLYYGVGSGSYVANPVKMTQYCDNWYYYEVTSNGQAVSFNLHHDNSASSSAYKADGNKDDFVAPAGTFEYSVASYNSVSASVPSCSAAASVVATTEGSVSPAVYVTNEDDEVLLTSGISWEPGDELPTVKKDDSDGRPGYFKLTGLRNGTYTLREATAPTGYTLNAATYRFTISDGNVTWENMTPDANDVVWISDAPTEVTWDKIDGTSGELLEGTSWDIKKDGAVVATIEDCTSDCATASADNWAVDVDDTGGQFRISYIPIGSYVLVEHSTVDGYELNTTEYPFEITQTEGQIAVVGDANNQIENTRILGTLNWTKVSSEDNSEELRGSEWTLTYKPDTGGDTITITIVDTAMNDGRQLPEVKSISMDSVTNNQRFADPYGGKFNVINLGWGTYTLTETKAPDGYNLNSTPYVFVINADNVSETVGLEIENEPGVVLPSAGTDQTARMVVILGAILTAVALLGISLLSRRAE